jgi:hypothetical protein
MTGPRRFRQLLFIGLLLQIAVLPLRGTRDVRTFKIWALHSRAMGLVSAYQALDPLVMSDEVDQAERLSWQHFHEIIERTFVI